MSIKQSEIWQTHVNDRLTLYALPLRDRLHWFMLATVDETDAEEYDQVRLWHRSGIAHGDHGAADWCNQAIADYEQDYDTVVLTRIGDDVPAPRRQTVRTVRANKMAHRSSGKVTAPPSDQDIVQAAISRLQRLTVDHPTGDAAILLSELQRTSDAAQKLHSIVDQVANTWSADDEDPWCGGGYAAGTIGHAPTCPLRLAREARLGAWWAPEVR